MLTPMSRNLPGLRGGLGGFAMLTAARSAVVAAPPAILDSLRVAFRRNIVAPPPAEPLDCPNPVDRYYGRPTEPSPLTVVDTVPTGEFPTGITVSPDGQTIYVVNTGSGSVSVVDASTDCVIGTFAVGHRPYGIATTPDGGHAYVANGGDGTVSVIELPLGPIVGTIRVGNDPHGVCVTPDGQQVFVTNQSDDTVSVIDPTLGMVIAVIAVGRGPTGLAVHPEGHRVYVAENDAGTIAVVDAYLHDVVDSIAVGRCPARVTLTPDGTRALVTNASDRSVTVIDVGSGTVVENVLLNSHPIGIATSRDGRLVFVSGLDAAKVAGEISVLDLAGDGLRTIPAGSPFDLAVNPLNGRCYATDFATNSVSVIASRDETDCRTSWHYPPSVRTMRIGRRDSAVTVDPGSGRVYAADADGGTVSMVDSWMQAATTAVGAGPTAVAVNHDNTRAYVTNYGDGSVTVIDTELGSPDYQQAVDTIAVGPVWSTALLLDTSGARAYAVTEGVPGIRVIDTARRSPTRHSVLATIALRAPLCDAKLCPNGNRVYAIDGLATTVSVLDTTTLTVSEIPLSGRPYRLTTRADGTRLYANIFGDGSLSVIDTDPKSPTYHSEVAGLQLGGHIAELVFSRDGTRAAVVDSDADVVRILDTTTNRHTTVGVGRYPWDVALSPDGRRAYVLNLQHDSVSVVDTVAAQVRATLDVGRHPSRIAMSRDGTHCFVTSHHDDCVSIIGTAEETVVNTVAVGPNPFDITIVADGTRAYIHHRGGVSVLSV